MRNETGDARWKAPIEYTDRSIFQAILTSLSRPFQLLFHESMCLGLCVFSAILLGILYLFFGAFPLLFTTCYHFKLWQVGLSFLGIGIGLIIGVLTDPIWIRTRLNLMAKLGEGGNSSAEGEPEFRLPPAIVGSVIAPVGLFIFAWTAYPWIHWTVPILGSCIFAIG